MDTARLRMRPHGQAGCRAPGLARRAPRPAPLRYQVADRAAEAPQDGVDDACSTSDRSRTAAEPRLGHHASSGLAARLALERLYASPLDWSRGLPLATVSATPGAAGPPAALAAQQQQQQAAAPREQRGGTGGGGAGPGGGDGRERSPDYYANVGDAIRTLREDIPLLFDRELNFSIYRDDITFRDPRNSFSGIQNYRTIFWSLRFHGRIFFRRIYVEVKRIWQTEDGLIRMRWTVHGEPRVPWEAEGIFDGISQYKLDHEGRIYEHAVDNVILRDPPVGLLPWLFSINLRPQQQAVPGAFFTPGPAADAAAAASACGGDGAGAGGGQQQRRGWWRRPEQRRLRQQQRQAAAPCHPAADVAAGEAEAAALAAAAAAAPPGWWAALLARFSWVRFYAAILATVRVLQQAQEQLQLLRPEPACAGER
ncbi:hypothetical protein Rsub_03280 [Raphidocelis subcapitata]|uniref:Uncharacterized protein n=1 Tax=Raphidocelis subcapitata TaxID=307507 RepID=A0A2V0NYZ6_9CHLO|nr:hypothetical protein Rsub_03280 [Raphidocelis subcapitata]|eukprot:GBF90147.1 hypothetical protein Rsub_03280 [Raphidocelis subcapitata]